jgi:hypothetical protein
MQASFVMKTRSAVYKFTMATSRRIAADGQTAWRPSSSVYSNDAATDSLLRRLSEMKRISEIRTIYALSNENQVLREEIATHYRYQLRMMAKLTKIVRVLLIIGKALEEFSSKRAAVTKDWLAFWGIYAEGGGRFSTEQPQWI